MIRCFLHQSALRRHLDDDGPASASAEKHLQDCPRCRAAYEAERSIVARLSGKVAAAEPPLFLRARILNAVRQTERETARFDWRWAVATAAIALLAALIATRSTPERQPAAQTLNLALNTDLDLFEAKVVVQAANMENPLEAEFQNLQNDTRNAARALAAGFLPSPER